MNSRLPIVIGSILALSACAAGPSYRTPKPDVPAHFAAQVNPPNASPANAASAAPVELATWWCSLNDVELNSLVDRAVKSNLL
jgi:outer membrane protein TolC